MFKRLKVFEFERGILFRDGRFVRVLDPGFHWIRGEVTMVDLHRRDTMVDVGPVLTRDLVPIGVRLKVSWRVRDPKAALLGSFEYRAQLVNDATASVHRALTPLPMAELAAEHNRLEETIQDRLALEVVSYGLRVEDVSIVQVRFPRALRRKLKRMEVGGLP
jgi:regulator of protease activity HflC (stomatin/prohibitin superfamily)